MSTVPYRASTVEVAGPGEPARYGSDRYPFTLVKLSVPCRAVLYCTVSTIRPLVLDPDTKVQFIIKPKKSVGKFTTEFAVHQSISFCMNL